MAILPIQDPEVLAGNPPDFQAGDPAGDEWINTTPEPEIYVYVTATAVLTFETKNDCEFGDHPNRTETVNPGQIVLIGQLVASRFTDKSSRLAKVTYDIPGNVMIAAVKPRRILGD